MPPHASFRLQLTALPPPYAPNLRAAPASYFTSNIDGDGGSSSYTTSLFALTILSGRPEAVAWAAKFVTDRVKDSRQVTLDFLATTDSSVLSLEPKLSLLFS